MEKKKKFLTSVNFHLWEPCNMQCKFCFARFQDVKTTILPKGHLQKDEALNIVKMLADFGFEKISFAGGEPTLCPWLEDLIKLAKSKGMTTMLITNGTKLTEDFLKRNQGILDWIAISIDSLNDCTNTQIGRSLKSGVGAYSKTQYESMVQIVKGYDYRLKINTVVNRYNFNEDFNHFIKCANPERWKVMQALPIAGQNDGMIDDLSITSSEFVNFVSKHKDNEFMVSESNEDMINSYAMIDPAGRFFSNETGKHEYSQSIIEVGVENALQKVNYDYSKFVSRGGNYNFKLKRETV